MATQKSAGNVLTRAKIKQAATLMAEHRLAEARDLLERLLETHRRDWTAWTMLAQIHTSVGDLAQAADCWRQAIDIDPTRDAGPHMNLGALLEQQRDYDGALKCYTAALALEPEHPGIHFHVGTTLLALDRPDEAVSHLRQALRGNPGLMLAHLNLALCLEKLGQIDEATTVLQDAIRLRPDFIEAHCNLSTLLCEHERAAEAAELCRAALQANPNKPALCFSLGSALNRLKQWPEAEQALRQALALQPHFAEAAHELAFALMHSDRSEEAFAMYQQILQTNPDNLAAMNNLQRILIAQGRVEDQVPYYRSTIEALPHNAGLHSDLLFHLNYLPAASSADIFAEHLNWARRHHRTAAPAPHANVRDPERRLRIGYVSSDLRRHSVSFFIEPILAGHDAAIAEVFCYANVKEPDDVTERLKRLAHHWRDIATLSDAHVAELIRHDEIDILVDLAGHTGNSRLLVFGLEPAPIQVTYLGYPNTTGLSVMHYRLTDRFADPDGEEQFHSEKLIRLPSGFLCFQPPVEAPGPSAWTPKSIVTFGSFNYLKKINDDTIDTWAQILKRVPQSRLVIKNWILRDPLAQRTYRQRFRDKGVDDSQVELVEWIKAPAGHLSLYDTIDIALDSFPYNGTTTTCEALWMGVPVIALAGERHAGRVGASLLNQIGLPELIARTREEYVQIAVDLARDSKRLGYLRATLRERMQASTLCNASAFTRELEQAYREMWKRWCTALTSPTAN